MQCSELRSASGLIHLYQMTELYSANTFPGVVLQAAQGLTLFLVSSDAVLRSLEVFTRPGPGRLKTGSCPNQNEPSEALVGLRALGPGLSSSKDDAAAASCRQAAGRLADETRAVSASHSVPLMASTFQPLRNVEDMETGGTDAPVFSDTLDEPILSTVLRDLKQIGTKLTYVLLPRQGSFEQLRRWDLWGPLLLCLLLATALSLSAPAGQSSLIFAAIFVIIWLGSAVVSINAQLLGSNLSFFQSVCILGYCIFPLSIAALACSFVTNFIFKLLVVLTCFSWSTAAALGFMWSVVEPDRKALAVYPIFLFYVSIGWIILVQ